MTPVVLTQPEPLEMILLLQCHQMLPQLVNLHALLHLLLSKCYQRCRIYIQLNLVRQRGALNLNAPTVIPILDERRIRVHEQLRKLALGRNLIYYRKTVALVANHQLMVLMAQYTHVNQPVAVELKGETVVVVIAHKFVGVVIYLILRNAQLAMHLVALGIVERETDVRNLKTEDNRIAAVLRNQGNSQSVIAEIILAAYESVIRLLSLLHLHLAVAPPEIEGDGLVVLSGYTDEILDVLTQVNHLGRLNLLIVIAQRSHPHLARNRIIFPFGISRGCSRFENEENHSFFFPRAIFAAREALRLLRDEEWG